MSLARTGRLVALLALPLLCLALPARSAAQEPYNFTIGVLGGLGGSPDAEHGDFGNPAFQVELSMVTDPRTHVGARLGRLDLGSEIGGLTDPQLTFLTISGEYRFPESYFESGMYLGLGAFRLEGDTAPGVVARDTSWGLTGGVTGEFPINPSFGVLVEIAGYYADFDEAQLFATAQAGLAIHF